MPRKKKKEMVVKNLNLPSFPTFDLGEVDSISSRWKKYKQRFELLCTAIGVTEEKQKLAMFLTYVGDETYEVYENVKPSDTNFQSVIEALDRHFTPQTNTSYETFVFRNLKQNDGECLNEFYIRLREQAAKCAFENTDLNIKQQIELSTNLEKLRLYSFQHPDKTLQELLTIGRTYEATTKQIQEITKNKRTTDEDVFYAEDRKRREQNGKNRNRGSRMSEQKSCYKCGGKFPHVNRCPAEGRT